MSLMEIARVNTCVGALVGGAAVGVGVEPHAEAIITSVISIIEIGGALIFLPPCGISTGVVRSITEFAKTSLIWYTRFSIPDMRHGRVTGSCWGGCYCGDG